jgi:hypothetical protein
VVGIEKERARREGKWEGERIYSGREREVLREEDTRLNFYLHQEKYVQL